MRAEVDAETRKAYDADLQVRARTIREQHADITSRLEAVAGALRRVQPEKDPNLDALRASTAQQRYQGRTRADLLKVYRATTDAANPTLIRMLEEDLDGFRLTNDPNTDLEAIPAWRKEMAARGDARILPEVQAARERAAALLKPLNVSHVRSILESGRGAAAQVGAPVLRAV